MRYWIFVNILPILRSDRADYEDKLGSELETLDKIPPKSGDFGGICLEKVMSFGGDFSLTTCLPTNGRIAR